MVSKSYSELLGELEEYNERISDSTDNYEGKVEEITEQVAESTQLVSDAQDSLDTFNIDSSTALSDFEDTSDTVISDKTDEFDAAIGAVGANTVGDYSTDPVLTNANDTAYYSGDNQEYKTKEGVSRPYTCDSTTYPDPNDDPNLQKYNQRDQVTSIAALQARGTETGYSVYLSLGGRSGWFEWRVGDFTSLVSLDADNNKYVASDSDPTGSLGCWVRATLTIPRIEESGAEGDGASDTGDLFGPLIKLTNAVKKYTSSAGVTVSLTEDGKYYLVLDTLKDLQLDIVGATSDTQSAHSVSRYDDVITLTSANPYSVGDMVKVVGTIGHEDYTPTRYTEMQFVARVRDVDGLTITLDKK